MEDKRIVKLLWNRAEAALEALAQKFGKRLHRLAMNILGNPRDAEETVNDTYLAVWNTVPPKEPEPLAGYVLKTGRNISLDRLKYNAAEKRNNRYDVSLDELEACIPGSCLEETVEDVLRSGDYAAMISQTEGFPRENSKHMKVNLSVPKFDVTAELDLRQGLENMGLTEIFNPFANNDFSPSVDSDLPVYLDSIRQNTRVSVEEEGLTAASYIKLNFGAGAAEPPEEIIDFVLDRPFLFAVTCSNIPMFIGTVQTP